MPLTQVNPGLLDTQAQYTGFKNRIFNGQMQIDQRNNGASVTLSSTTQFPVDRFGVSKDTAGATCTAQRSTVAPAGFTNSLLWTTTTGASPSAGDDNIIRQYVEGFNFADFGFGTANASTFTISFWVRSSITGTYGLSLANSAATRCFMATYTVNTANTLEYKTITVSGDTSGTWLTDNGIGLRVFFDLGSGSSRSIAASSSWGSSYGTGLTGGVKISANTGATFYITGVQLEKGPTATSFDYRPYGTELALCQRYFWQLGNTGSLIGYVFPQPGNQPSGGGGMPIVFPNPVRMRVQPDVGYNISSGNYTTSDPSGTQWRLVAPAIDACSLSGSTVGIVGLSSVTYAGISLLYANISRQPAVLQLGSTAVISFSSEL